MRATIASAVPTDGGPPPAAPPPGARALTWKQDPSVSELGIRKVFLPGVIVTGPRDARILPQGLPPVAPNVMGDFIQTPGTDAFDAVHTFAVVRSTLTMYQRALSVGQPTPVQLPWHWNIGTNVDPIKVFPHHSNMMNAFYSRQQKLLAFGFFTKPGAPPTSPPIFTCRSLDIVSHETGHAVLDALKPGWLGLGAPPQTGGLHESFGDLSAIFLAMAQMDQVEAVIAQTKANLHEKTFLADLAEEFGLALGRPNGLRNADNDLKLSDVGTEVHAISQVFTGGIYDVMADIFAARRDPARRDDAIVLYEVAQLVFSLVLRAIRAAPAQNAIFADVVNQMIAIGGTSDPVVGTSIRNRFIFREVLSASPVSLDSKEVDHSQPLKAVEHHSGRPEAVQDRHSCCGTMQLPEHTEVEKALRADIEALLASMNGGDGGRNGGGSASRTAAKQAIR
jgi:hypothetical protein